jgi:hypothetical protein
MSRRTVHRSDAWSLTAIFAALAIMVQALMPAVAVAQAGRDGGALLQICSGAGVKTETAPAPKGFAGFKCADCAAASLASVTPVATPLPLRVGAPVVLTASLRRAVSLAPRGPPRLREQSPRAPPTI